MFFTYGKHVAEMDSNHFWCQWPNLLVLGCWVECPTRFLSSQSVVKLSTSGHPSSQGLLWSLRWSRVLWRPSLSTCLLSCLRGAVLGGRIQFTGRSFTTYSYHHHSHVALLHEQTSDTREDSEEKLHTSGAVGHCPTCRAQMHLEDLHPHQVANGSMDRWTHVKELWFQLPW